MLIGSPHADMWSHWWRWPVMALPSSNTVSCPVTVWLIVELEFNLPARRGCCLCLLGDGGKLNLGLKWTTEWTRVGRHQHELLFNLKYIQIHTEIILCVRVYTPVSTHAYIYSSFLPLRAWKQWYTSTSEYTHCSDIGFRISFSSKRRLLGGVILWL